MAEKEMDQFIELVKSGDHRKLVAFAKTLKVCPNCDYELTWENNEMRCGSCGLSILNIDPPNPLRGSKGVW